MTSRDPMTYPRCAVRLRDPNGVVVGSGVLMLGRYVVTCAHVVCQAVGESNFQVRNAPTTAVTLDAQPFDDASRRGLKAKVVAWRPGRRPARRTLRCWS